MASEFQREKLRAMFDAFDADGNGYLEEADFAALAIRWGRLPRVRTETGLAVRVESVMRGWWQQLSAAVDTDEDGRIDMDDLLAMVDLLPSIPDAVTATAIVAVLGLIVVAPLYLATGGLRTIVADPQAAAMQALFQGLVSAVLATLAYSAAVTRLGPSRAGIFPSLVPAVAVVMAVPTLGIVPTILQVTGIALATIGLVLAIGLLDRRGG